MSIVRAIQVGWGTYVCLDCLKPKQCLISERCKRCALINRYLNPAVLKQYSDTGKTVWARPGMRERQLENRRQYLINHPEVRTKLKKKATQAWAKPHIREKMAQAAKKRWAKPGERERASKRSKQVWARPEVYEKMSGSNNLFWRGGNRLLYGPEFKRNFKETIRKRDDYLCQRPGCYLPENGRHHSVHHIDYNKKNNDPTNLITLCHNCHGKTILGNRQYWQEYFQSLQSMRGLE